jgi:4-diphosphocytidyl-2-C-methyl-D-erythritol kinase
MPSLGVSTPAAFKAWDALVAGKGVDSVGEPMSHKRDIEQSDLVDSSGVEVWAQLTSTPNLDKLQELSLAYSSLSAKTGSAKTEDGKPGTSGIVRDSNPEKKQGLSGESQNYAPNDLAENTLLALVRTGIGNDFEEVVFPQYPSLRITKRQLMGSDSDGSDVSRPAIYAALSGSGSALFGLYRSEADAKAAQQRVQSSGVQALLTETLPRAEYWERMFAE